MTDNQYEKIIESIEQNMDGIIGPIIQVPGYADPIDLDDCTEDESHILINYFGSTVH